MKALIKRMAPPRLCRVATRTLDRFKTAAFLCSSIGGSITCPFCGLHFKRMLPFAGARSRVFEREHIVGGEPFDHSECPWCGSFERERHAYLFLRDSMAVFNRRLRLLHVAPEPVLQRRLRRSKAIHAIRTDIHPGNRELDLVCDMTQIPLPSESIDAVVCNHVLEHIRDDRAAMREVFRVLKPGAWAMLQVPLAVTRATTEEDLSVDSDEERLRRYGQRDHVRLYGRDYPDRLASAGFVVERHDSREKFGEQYMRRYALISDEVIYLARKPGGTGANKGGHLEHGQ